jgi:hypothetical protein
MLTSIRRICCELRELSLIYTFSFLGAFAKLRKRLLASSYLLVRSSVRLLPWNNSAAIERIFAKFDTGVFRKSFEKIQN